MHDRHNLLDLMAVGSIQFVRTLISIVMFGRWISTVEQRGRTRHSSAGQAFIIHQDSLSLICSLRAHSTSLIVGHVRRSVKDGWATSPPEGEVSTRCTSLEDINK